MWALFKRWLFAVMGRTVKQHEDSIKDEVRREEDALADRRRKTAGELVATIAEQTDQTVQHDRKLSGNAKLDLLRRRMRATSLDQ